MNHRVVRRFASDTTHVMDVTATYPGEVFGAKYRQPEEGRAACGVLIADGVVMKPGTKTRCTACRHLTGVTTQPEESTPANPQRDTARETDQEGK